MIKACIFVCAVLLICCVSAQAEAKSPVYARFRVLLTNGERLAGKSGVFQNDTIMGKSMAGLPLSIPVNNIRAMDRYARNRAAEGSLIGCGLGLLTGLSVLLDAKAQEKSDPLVAHSSAVGKYG